MNAITVELVYEKTCPNIEAARLSLLHAFADVGITPRWREWDVSAPETPDHVHGYGSPTILVNGRDVSGEMGQADDYCCRVYSHEGANKGVPPIADIVRALSSGQRAGAAEKHRAPWRLNSGALN